MRYKTLFRLLIKALGVWFLAEGLVSLVSAVGQAIGVYTSRGASMPEWWLWVGFLKPLAQIGIGTYLFYGGRWFVDRAIPGNKPYCHECGYELTHVSSNRCPECGTEFRAPGPDDS